MFQRSLSDDPAAARPAAMSSAFACTLRDGGLASAWVHCAGELDLATAPLLERTLRRAKRRSRLIVLDLRELTFMDCAGVHLIMEASIRGRRASRALVLVRGPAQVDRLLALAGVSDVVAIGDLAAAEPPAPDRLRLLPKDGPV